MSEFNAESEPRDSTAGLIRSEVRRQVRECPICGRRIHLNREGAYRRHFAAEPDGRRHLCVASGQLPPEDSVAAVFGGEDRRA